MNAKLLIVMGLLMAICVACLYLAACSSLPVASAAGMATGPEGMIVVVVDNPPEAGPLPVGSTAPGYEGAGSYSVSSSARRAVATLASRYDLRLVRGWAISQLGVYCVVFALPPPATPATVLAALAQDPLVKSAQPLQRFSTLGASAPAPRYNDPYFSLQSGFQAIDAGGAQQWTSGAAVRVAVIDTGIDSSHPDLRGRVLSERNFVDADPGQFHRDRHGTAVAGIIAANANNHEGIVGVAPGVSLLALKACWQGAGDGAECNSFTLAEALSAALDARAQVINLSLGGPADPLLAQLVRYALGRGVAVVGAVPPSGRLDGFPVGIAGVIAVDSGDAQGDSRVLPAPGHEVLTLTPGGHYDFASGSSLAAAHVSGAVALLLAINPHLDTAALTAALRASIRAGAGGVAAIDVCVAVARVRATGRCEEAPAGVLAAH